MSPEPKSTTTLLPLPDRYQKLEGPNAAEPVNTPILNVSPGSGLLGALNLQVNAEPVSYTHLTLPTNREV